MRVRAAEVGRGRILADLDDAAPDGAGAGEMLGTFTEDLSKLTRAIRRGDGEALFEHFTRTRAIRRGIVEIGQDSAAADFGRPHANLAKRPD